ncbi:hypothetical protein [Devosia sp. MC1541]|uniref:hypothetical protein n=1 Tax=Devosia sp. MC1541 TaxID=2725264 RepID=UPI00145EEA6D|nr:hypothetical protein [Devosia sp. MC1541]
MDQEGSTWRAQASGTAIADDYTNINGSLLKSEEGQSWSFTLKGAFSGQGAATVRLSAVSAEGKYLGEISEGIPLSASSTEVTLRGVAPSGTDRVLPYIQLLYSAGDVVDDVVEIAGASVASAPKKRIKT